MRTVKALSGGSSMVIGLTMIKVRSGFERSVYADLQKRPEVRDIYRLFGEYNFFLVMQAEGKGNFNRILKDIKDEEQVIKTGPILLTADADLAEVSQGEPVSSISIG
jgi:DNA-binding Lrp family transcriptional regulator